MVGLLCLAPGFGSHVDDLPVDHRRQAGEDFPQVGWGGAMLRLRQASMIVNTMAMRCPASASRIKSQFSLRCAFGGLNELAPRMSPARGQRDAAFASVRKRGVGGVAVAVHGALEVGGDDAVQSSRCASGGPGEAHIGSGSFAGPEVALFGFAVAGTQILHRGLLSLRPPLRGSLSAGYLATLGSSICTYPSAMTPVWMCS